MSSMTPITIEKNCDLFCFFCDSARIVFLHDLPSQISEHSFICLLLTYRLLYELHAIMQTNESQAFFFFLILVSPDLCAKI